MPKHKLCLLIASLVLAATQAHAFDLGSLFKNEQLDKLKGSGTAAPAAPPAAASGSSGSSGSSLAKFSSKDQVGSLKQALTQGAETAVSNLSRENGFLGNDKVRIPLPASLQKVEGMLRTFGMGSYADELVTSMNRAAEAAVPEAKALLVSAVKF